MTKPVEGTVVRIQDKGEVLELPYDGAMTEHKGSLWWGTAVGFRAMQAAAEALSKDELWSRENLYVVGAHPGPGVKDAINYVTGTVDRDRYKCVVNDNCDMKCNSQMKFEWWISDGEKTAAVKLRPDFVPKSFYELSDRLGTPEESAEDKRAFNIFKVNLSARIWNALLAESFSVELIDKPLEPGQLPEAMKAADYWTVQP